MSVVINLQKAKDIAQQILRTERKPVLESLDIQFMRAVESGNTQLQTAIASEKQSLRDITSHESIVDAEDVDGLKTAMDALIQQIKE